VLLVLSFLTMLSVPSTGSKFEMRTRRERDGLISLFFFFPIKEETDCETSDPLSIHALGWMRVHNSSVKDSVEKPPDG